MSKVEAVIEALRSRIEAGEFGINGGLPSQKALSERYSVSLDTVKRALDHLAQEGLIATQGKGYRIDRVERIIRTHSGVTSFANTLKDKGHTPNGRNIVNPYITIIPDTITSLCNLSIQTKAVYRAYVRGTESRMYEIAEFWYPVPEAEGMLQGMQENPEGAFLDEIMRQRSQSWVQAEEMVTCRHATHQEVQHLTLSKNAYVLESLINCYEPNSRQTLTIMKIVSVHTVVHRYTYPYRITP